MQEIATQLRAALDGLDPQRPLPALLAATDAWLHVCAQQRVHRILLVDGPAVLGWPRWRALASQDGGGVVVSELLTRLMEAGTVERQSVPALTHALLGALRESALYASSSPEAEGEAREVLQMMMRSLLR